MECLSFATPLKILGTGAGLVLAGQLTLGAMLSLGAMGVGFLTPLSSLVGTWMRVQELTSVMERIDDVLDEEVECEWGTAPAPCGRAYYHSGRDVPARTRATPTVENVTLEMWRDRTWRLWAIWCRQVDHAKLLMVCTHRAWAVLSTA
jgi:ABC-type bacteriocin/lantibiotic exporter with double-glycine peptidase domain